MSNTQGSESFRDEERKKMMKFFDHVSPSSGSASDIVKQEEAVIDHLPAEEKLRSLLIFLSKYPPIFTDIFDISIKSRYRYICNYRYFVPCIAQGYKNVNFTCTCMFESKKLHI